MPRSRKFALELLSLCPKAELEPALPLGLALPVDAGSNRLPLALFGVSVSGTAFGLHSQLEAIPDEELENTTVGPVCAPLPAHFDGLVHGGHFGWFDGPHTGFERVLLLSDGHLYGNRYGFAYG